MEPIHWWLIAWFVGALATALYGWWCGRLTSPLDYDAPDQLGWVFIWPIALVMLIGAHIRRGRKTRPWT